jgi:hypothetical protein
MQRMVHTLALAAALVALVASLWQDWGTATTLKRMLISYLAFYFLGAVLALLVRLAGPAAGDRPADDASLEGAKKDRT